MGVVMALWEAHGLDIELFFKIVLSEEGSIYSDAPGEL